MGRHTVPPHITKRTTTNLKTKSNQNCQKIELYGIPTTKELKKKTPIQTGRMDRDEQLGREGSSKGGGYWTRAGKAAAGGPGEETDCRLGSPTFTCR